MEHYYKYLFLIVFCFSNVHAKEKSLTYYSGLTPVLIINIIIIITIISWFCFICKHNQYIEKPLQINDNGEVLLEIKRKKQWKNLTQLKSNDYPENSVEKYLVVDNSILNAS